MTYELLKFGQKKAKAKNCVYLTPQEKNKYLKHCYNLFIFLFSSST